MAESEKVEFLQTGDLILLRFKKEATASDLKVEKRISGGAPKSVEHCFVSVDGIVDSTASIVATFDVNAISDIRDCLFRITYKLSYRAKKDFDKRKRQGAEQKELDELQSKVEKEEAQNKEKLDARCRLTYGETIQLLHVKSGKFLTIMPNQTAEYDKQSRKVVVKEPVVHSAWRIAAFYPHRLTGQPVVYDEQFILKAFKLPLWSLYVDSSKYLPPAINPPKDLQFYEVSCSTNLCGFYPELYARDPETLNFASCVRFFHNLTGCFMGASCSDEDEGKRPFMKRIPEPNRSIEDPLNLWSKGCWVVEPPYRHQGGPVYWGAPFCLKHVGSGKYFGVKRGDSDQAALISSVDEPSYISLHPIEAVEDKEVKINKAFRTKCLIKYEDEDGELWLGASRDVPKEKPKGLEGDRPSLEIVWTEESNIREAIELENLDQSFPDYVQNVNGVVSRKHYMLTAIQQIKAYPNKSPKSRASTASNMQSVLEADRIEFLKSGIFDKINEVVTSSIFYLTGDVEIDDALKCSNDSIVEHQHLVKDLKYIDATVLLKDALWSSGYRVSKLTSRTEVDLGIKGQVLSGKPELPPPRLRTLKLLIEHWRASFQDNRTVENYFNRKHWVTMLNDLNGLGLGAAKALMQLLNNNPALVKALDPQVIEQFSHFISNLGPDVEWMKFLTAVCSCMRIPIPTTQLLVLRIMYFPGDHATPAQKRKWSTNRENLHLSIKMGHLTVAPFPRLVGSREDYPEEMLARELIESGVREIFVSWVTDDDLWGIGFDHLYFHPRQLQLDYAQDIEKFTVGKKSYKLWVKLCDIVWVLDPIRTYSIVHKVEDDAWKRNGEGVSKEPVFAAWTVLAKFFVGQMDMFAEICMDRQMNAIAALESEYHFNLMVCGLYHHALAPPVRRAFCSLLINLWLDRHPHYRLKMPNEVHKWEGVDMTPVMRNLAAPKSSAPNITGLPKFELLDPHADVGRESSFSDFYSMKESTKFFALFSYGKHHMAKMKGNTLHCDEGNNGYTVEVVELMNCMADFGFFFSIDLVREFMTAMLPCMDGRCDMLEDPVPDSSKYDTFNEANGSDLGSNMDDSSQPLLGMTCGPQGKSVCDRFCMRGGTTNGSIWNDESHHDEAPVYLDIEDAADGIDRYPSNDTNDIVHEIKFRMLQLSNRILQFSLNSAIERAVEMFRKSVSQFTENLRESLVDDSTVSDFLEFIEAPEYDLDDLSGGVANILLLDLLLYENADVFTSTLSVLRSWNHRLEIVMDSLQSVRLLVEPDDFAKYDVLKKDTFRLTNLMYTRQIWGVADEFCDADDDRIAECKSLLKRLREFCSVGGEGNDSDEPDVATQDTLACFSVDVPIRRVLDIPLSELEGEAKEHAKEIFVLTTQLCVQYANNHRANQFELFKQTDQWMVWFSYGLGAANVVSAIFSGNRELCESLPSAILYQFAKILQENHEPGGPGFLPHQLGFLQGVIVVDERPVPKNKTVVLEIMKDPKYSKLLHLLTNTPEDVARRGELLKNFHSYDQLTKPRMFRKWRGGDAELQYYNLSLELLATMCVGKDSTGAMEYVESQLPALQLAAEYLDIDNIQVKCSTGLPNSNDVVAMCRVLKCTLLSLLELCYYKGSNQVAFQISSVHARMMKSFFDSLLRLEPKIVESDLTPLDEAFILRLLKTLASYSEFVYHTGSTPEIRKIVGEDIKNSLSRLYTGTGKLPTPTKHKQYKAVLMRTLGFIINDQNLSSIRLISDNRDGDKGRTAKSMMMNSAFQEFVGTFVNSDIVKERIASDHQMLIDTFIEMESLTDATDVEYSKELAIAQEERRPLKSFEYRRNRVTKRDLVQRIFTHVLNHKHMKDWETTEFALHLLNDILINMQEDESELREFQNWFLECGAVQFITTVLMAEPNATVKELTIKLGIVLLEPCNKTMQDGFMDYFDSIDETPVWQAWNMMYEQVMGATKIARALKQWKFDARSNRELKDVSLTSAENTTLEIYSRDLLQCIHCMRLLQVLCEGGNLLVQIYVTAQGDNNISFDFCEKTWELFMKLCKNNKSANILDEEEADCAQQALDLLIETTTGPCPRNQEVVSVSGIVETSQKLLVAPFHYLRSQTVESYPSEVRELKSKTVMMLQGLLELRQDKLVHKNLVIRLEATIMRRRIVFIHRWFLADTLKLNENAAAVSSQLGWGALIDDLEADDGMETPDDDPIVLLDSLGMVEEKLNDYFNEGFTLIILRQLLMDMSEHFKEQTEPSITPFRDKRSLYVNFAQYSKAKLNHHVELKYKAAFEFFNQWINVIEIVVNGKLFDLYFRIPMLCNFVLGHAKTEIVNNVAIDSPDNKAKDFCSMTQDAYVETLHTRALSKWGFEVPGMKRVRPFNFFLKNDSQNMTAVSEYCLGLSTLLNFCLFFALQLPPPEKPPEEQPEAVRLLEEPERLLKKKSKKHGGGGGGGGVGGIMPWPIMLDDWFLYIQLMGYIYTLMMFSAMVVAISIHGPLEYRTLMDEIGDEGAARFFKTFSSLFLVGATLYLVHFMFGINVAFLSLTGVFMLLQVGGSWAGTPSSCPNNLLAKMLATAAMSMNRQNVSRRVMLVASSLGGNLEMYFFYSFPLLDLLFLSPMLQNVIKAVTVPFHSLVLTTIVGIIVMYEYAIVAFYFFRPDYAGTCNSMVDCTTTTIYQGLRMDIGSAITPTFVSDGIAWYKRMLFDLSFFVIITTILMNVIFGIIIDTFGSLRDATHEHEDHLQNNTFISCIDRGDADKAGQALGIRGFEYLENVKQNRWSYFNFIFYLKRKDPLDYSGPERIIRALLDEQEVTWMPLTVCKLMESNEEEMSETQIFQAEVQENVSKLEVFSRKMPDSWKGSVRQTVREEVASIRYALQIPGGGSSPNLGMGRTMTMTDGGQSRMGRAQTDFGPQSPKSPKKGSGFGGIGAGLMSSLHTEG